MRYSRSSLGFFWAFLSPFLTIAVLYTVFSLILQIKIKEANFLLYLMSAIFPWRFFHDSLLTSTSSLVDNRNLIKESNFPHFFIPLSIVLSNTLVFIPALFILIIISFVIYGGLSPLILFLPFILIIHTALVLGASIILSVLYVRCRDTKHILEFILLVLFYLTPIFYSIYLVKESFSNLFFNIYISNPFVGILNLYRLAILKGFYGAIEGSISLFNIVVVPTAFSIIVLFLGFFYYKKSKKNINDYLSY